MAKYGYTDINISGDDIVGNTVRFGGGSCPSSQGQCHGYAEYLDYNYNFGPIRKTWVDGNGDYGCQVPEADKLFDKDTPALQVDILTVADSKEVADAAAAATEAAKKQGQQLGHFTATFAAIAWDCFPKDY